MSKKNTVQNNNKKNIMDLEVIQNVSDRIIALAEYT